MVNRGTQGELPAAPEKEKEVVLDPLAKNPAKDPAPKKAKPKVSKKKESDEGLRKDIFEDLQKQEDSEFMKDYDDVDMNSLIMNGYVEHVCKITDNFSIKLRTLKKKEELAIKQRISEYDGVQMYILDQINVDTLCYALVEINGSPLLNAFDDEEAFSAKKERVSDFAEVLTLEMFEQFRNLNKALVILIKGSSKNSLARRLLGQDFA